MNRYSNKVHGVRVSVDGYPLPAPRSLRYNALPDKDVPETTVNMMYVNFGQFITHDMVHTPFYQAEDGLFLDCCYGYKGGEQQVSPKCYALPVPHDPFYSTKTKETCLNFARAVVAPNYDCTAGYSNPVRTAFMLYILMPCRYFAYLNDFLIQLCIPSDQHTNFPYRLVSSIRPWR